MAGEGAAGSVNGKLESGGRGGTREQRGDL